VSAEPLLAPWQNFFVLLVAGSRNAWDMLVFLVTSSRDST